MNLVSVAHTIVIDVEKFLKATATDAEKFAVAFQRIFKKSPTVIQTIENFINEAAPVIVAADALVAPEAEPEVAGALVIIQTGLAALQASASAAVSGESVLVALENFAGTVPQLLTGLAIKNPILQASVIRIVNLVTNEAKVLIPVVRQWISEIKAKTPAAAPSVA